jgi:hypothetical protein
LAQPTSDVVSATIRGGSYADKNNQWTLETRAADNLEYVRRALLKFDTENTIPKGSAVTSATLTVTVKDGSADASRTIGAYQTTLSWTESEVTWKARRVGSNWQTSGGDYGSKLDQEVVSNVPGSTVTFDVTPLVKAAVAGDLGSSRYTRIALMDLDGSTSDSYRAYFAPNDVNTAVRPVLTVTYGGSTTTTTTTSTSTATTLRVLHWNTHHGGVGSDGVWDPDRLVTWIAKFNPDAICFGMNYLANIPEVVEFSGYTVLPDRFDQLLRLHHRGGYAALDRALQPHRQRHRRRPQHADRDLGCGRHRRLGRDRRRQRRVHAERELQRRGFVQLHDLRRSRRNFVEHSCGRRDGDERPAGGAELLGLWHRGQRA